MPEKTRAQLAEENEELRARVAELEAGASTASRSTRPVLPSFGLSEGTRLDVLEAQNSIRNSPTLNKVELVEPFTGKTLTVTADDVTMTEAEDQPDQLPEGTPDPETPSGENNPF